MNIFIAGGTGAIGRVLVPLLVNAGHKVVSLARSPDRASQLEQMGAVPVIDDVYDEVRLARLVAESEAEVVIHQLTAFGTKDGDPYAETIRVRIEGTRSLIAAARAARARRFIAQSISFMCTPFGSGLTDEETPLYLDAPPAVRALAEAIASLEQQTLSAQGMSGAVLRYGWFYGPVPATTRKAPFRPRFAKARCRSWVTAPGFIRSSICAMLPQQRSRSWRTKQTEFTTSLMTRRFDGANGCRSRQNFSARPRPATWMRPWPGRSSATCAFIT